MARKKMKSSPVVLCRVELTPQEKERFDAIAEARGMTQTAALSRLVEWFTRQPAIVQVWIFGHMPAEVRDQAMKSLVEQLAKAMKVQAEAI